MLKYRSLFFFAGVISLSLLAYYGIKVFENDHQTLPYYGESSVTDSGERVYRGVPPFHFVDQQNLEITDNLMDGKISIVNYFFTSCPTICPQMTYNLQKVHDLYRNDPEVLILSFTVDPKRDKPERLMEYAERYNVDHDKWRFLTGKKSELYSLARKGFFLSATEGPGDENDFIHSENLVILDQEKKIRGYYNGMDSPSIDKLVKDIYKLKKGKT